MSKKKREENVTAKQIAADLAADPQLASEFVRNARMLSDQAGGDQAGDELAGGDQAGDELAGGDSANLLNPDAQLAELEAVEEETEAENERLTQLLAHVADVLGQVLTTGGHLLRATQARQLVDLERRVKAALNPSNEGK